MKIILFSKYGKLGASSRIRSYQYLPYIEKSGILIDIFPLFSDAYLNILYNRGKRSKLYIINSYFKRLINLFNIKRYDLIWIEKELFPYMPPIFERIFKTLNLTYILDYDDAVFHNYDLNKNFFIKFLLKDKIKIIMKNAKLVIVGNEYLANYARKAGAKNILLLPSSIDLNKYTYSDKFNINNFKIGWIGTPMTFKYINPILEIILEFCKNYNSKLILIGANSEYFNSNYIEYKKWYENREIEYIKDIDVGLMPLFDTPWERGKCGYKLLQYMACGRPVIASPVGINNEIIIHGINGFLVKNVEDWYKYLLILYNNINLRKKMGKIGRKLVEEKFSLEKNALKLIKILKNIEK